MVDSVPGLRSGLTADIRACLKMHLIIERRGKQPKQAKTKQKKCLQSSRLQKSHKQQRMKNVQISEDDGFTA